jgi:phosphatidylglycerol lysyltransferase
MPTLMDPVRTAVIAPVPAEIGRAEAERIVACVGSGSISPFLTELGNSIVRVAEDSVAGYRSVGRWAVMPTAPVAPDGFEADALDGVLRHLRGARRRPVFVAVADPEPFEARGLHTTRVADEAVVDLRAFTLDGKRMASIRHSVTSARRAELRVVPYAPEHRLPLARISDDWLATKRGGEMGFTLGRFDPDALTRVDCRVCVDADERPVGFVTWRPFAAGRSRVLDLMRRASDAPNPTMDLLIADGLLEFAAAGCDTASLSAVPLSHGRVAERLYPTSSLRRYKDKFAPTWEPLWLVVPSARALPRALGAVARAFCPDGPLRAMRRNAS